jgi:23S rRNA (adenine1618-N6)-methyltransferase
MKVAAQFHPRNRHQGQYDLDALKLSSPEFAPFVAKNKYGNDSIDFADPEAVKALNRALLKNYYGVNGWDIPKNSLCPPIPGRADYVHQLADLLATTNKGEIPRGSETCILDIGVGANCIYPLIGYHEYGWSFLGSDINPISLKAAQANADANPDFANHVGFVLQETPPNIFEGIFESDFHFDATMCNPPFHASLEDAQAGSRRKWKNLGKRPAIGRPHVNFGGEGAEIWCDGGELEFTSRMIRESVKFAKQCTWFTTLVSQEDYLFPIYDQLRATKIFDWQTLDMAQGQKKSRIVAWTLRK